jgi:glycosyltransferase involved in cell wall biosynthesis
MKILMLHNRYRERGGEDYSSAAEVNLLRSAGIECVFHQVDNRDVKRFGLSSAVNAVWSHSTMKEVASIVLDRKINVVHVQNFFPQLSPSVYWGAGSTGAAVVQSLRNYRLACVNGQFFRDGRVCEDCLGRTPLSGVIHRCYRESLAGSGVVASMLVAHRMIGTWSRRVDRYIAVSEFTRLKMIEGGLPADKIDVKPNFLESIPPAPGSGAGGYFAYVGRISKEKGIRTLIEAWRLLPSRPPLKIIGTGPLDDFVRSAIATMPHITALGACSAVEVQQILAQARALVFPSEWYETFGRVAMEAYSVGTPVIASDIGAVAEIVQDGITGLRFRAGSTTDLAAAVERFLGAPNNSIAMRLAARETFLKKYTPSRNIELLLKIYERAMSAASKRKSTKILHV